MTTIQTFVHNALPDKLRRPKRVKFQWNLGILTWKEALGLYFLLLIENRFIGFDIRFFFHQEIHQKNWALFARKSE